MIDWTTSLVEFIKYFKNEFSALPLVLPSRFSRGFQLTGSGCFLYARRPQIGFDGRPPLSHPSFPRFHVRRLVNALFKGGKNTNWILFYFNPLDFIMRRMMERAFDLRTIFGVLFIISNLFSVFFSKYFVFYRINMSNSHSM